MRWILGATSFFVVATISYCHVYDSSLLDSGIPAPGSGIGWWSGYEGKCYSAKAPAEGSRPAPGDPGNVAPIYLAISKLRIGSLDAQGNPSTEAWRDLGLDLDGVCTASDTCDTELRDVSCAPTKSNIPVDGNYCRDNTFGKLEVQAATIPEVGGKYGLNDDAFNCGLCTGAYNFIIRVSAYNGTPNDDKVRVDFYPSPGLEVPLPWDCSKPDWKIHPCFTSDLPWLVRDNAVSLPQPGPNLPDAVVADQNAYVRDGYIIGTLPKDTLVWFPSIEGRKADVATAFPLTFANGVIMGKLKKAPDGTWIVEDGTIAGRSREADVIHGFRLIGFCDTTDPTNYMLMTNFLHVNLDILASAATDATQTCDAISVGMGFTAQQAVAGKLIHVDDLVECATGNDAGTDGGDASVGDAAGDAGTD